MHATIDVHIIETHPLNSADMSRKLVCQNLSMKPEVPLFLVIQMIIQAQKGDIILI